MNTFAMMHRNLHAWHAYASTGNSFESSQSCHLQHLCSSQPSSLALQQYRPPEAAVACDFRRVADHCGPMPAPNNKQQGVSLGIALRSAATPSMAASAPQLSAAAVTDVAVPEGLGAAAARGFATRVQLTAQCMLKGLVIRSKQAQQSCNACQHPSVERSCRGVVLSLSCRHSKPPALRWRIRWRWQR